MKRHERYTIIAIFAIILLATILGVGIWWFIHAKDTKQPQVFEQIINTTYPFSRLLDGQGVLTEVEAKRRPVAIIIDNSSDARPAVGVENASVVYETIAEGSITRQLAIFDPEELPEVVGPVRSLRPYFLVWAGEQGAITVHVGGSPQALVQAETKDTVNEFFSGAYFWRDSKRFAPHNTFTSKEFLLARIEEKGFATSTPITSMWEYATKPPAFAIKAEEVSVDFSIDEYAVTWTYNPKTQLYTRTIDGMTIPDLARNIVVQVVDARVLDSLLRRELTLEGTGDVWIIRDGTVSLGVWKKLPQDEKTMFVDAKGDPIPLAPGTTWVEVIDDSNRFSF